MEELVQYLPVAMFVLGGALGLLRLIPIVFIMDINVSAFNHQIKQLISANNVERGIKLCNAVPTAVAAKGTRGMLKAFQEDKVTDGVALREAYDRELGGLARATSARAWASLLGLVIVATGAGLGFSMNLYISTTHLAIGGGAMVVVLISLFKSSALRKKAVAGREEVIRHIQDRALQS